MWAVLECVVFYVLLLLPRLDNALWRHGFRYFSLLGFSEFAYERANMYRLSSLSLHPLFVLLYFIEVCIISWKILVDRLYPFFLNFHTKPFKLCSGL